MQYHSFNDEWVKTVSQDEFVTYGLEHTDYTEIDLKGYWKKVNPTVKAEKPADPETTEVKKKK